MKSLSFVSETSSAKSVWEHFHAISQIPRPSGHEQQLKQHIIELAHTHGLLWKQDAAGNLVVCKQATPGRESSPSVTLQGHLDMVAEKNDDSTHDFLKDPIQFVLDGDWLKANGTTLGADNGIGVAAALAILTTKDIEHGPLEALFTIEEETTMAGAEGVDPEMLQGQVLLNLDTEEDDHLIVGCAGGINVEVRQSYTTETTPAGYQGIKLSLTGLKGGHSGCDIHLQRANAVQVMVRVLKRLQTSEMRISEVKGGTVDNAIPRRADALVVVPEAKFEEFTATFDKALNELQREFRSVEPDLTFKLETVTAPETLMALPEQKQWLNALHACHNGVKRFSDDFEGVVETSNNLGVLKLAEGSLSIDCFARSLVDSSTVDIANNIVGVFELAGADVKVRGFFPGWKPEPTSKIKDLMVAEYTRLNGEAPGVEVIHAALECGILGAARPGMDMISFGPTIKFPHSPDERILISSVDSFWNLLKATLQSLK